MCYRYQCHVLLVPVPCVNRCQCRVSLTGISAVCHRYQCRVLWVSVRVLSVSVPCVTGIIAMCHRYQCHVLLVSVPCVTGISAMCYWYQCHVLLVSVPCVTGVMQPRRISAVSIAERVAQERCENLGLTSGYSVRFESVFPRPYSAILYCTVGELHV